MGTYSDRELEAMDRAAVDHLAREDFARRHSEWRDTNDWAASIVMAPFAALQRAAAKADARRFRNEPLTGFGSFDQGDEEAADVTEMLEAGVKHINERRLSGGDLRMRGLVNVFGLCFPENEPTEELSKAVVDASGGDCTGAMHHAVMGRLAYIASNGWDKYCEEVRKHESAGAST